MRTNVDICDTLSFTTYFLKVSDVDEEVQEMDAYDIEDYHHATSSGAHKDYARALLDRAETRYTPCPPGG